MRTYSEFQPSGFDAKGLGLDDRQDWLVCPVTVNRDSDCLTRSNWAVVTAELIACSEMTEQGEPDCEVHEFGHWACGWFKVAIVRPGSKSAEIALAWENALADYPVACDDHFSGLETNEAAEYWSQSSLHSRRDMCERAKVSRFAAYKPFGSLPDRLTERLTEGL